MLTLFCSVFGMKVWLGVYRIGLSKRLYLPRLVSGFMHVLARCDNLGVLDDFRRSLRRSFLPQSAADLRQGLKNGLWLKNRFPKFLIRARDAMSSIIFISQTVNEESDSLVIMSDMNVVLACLHGTLAVSESAV